MNLILHYIDHENVIDGNTITLLDLFFFMKLHSIDVNCIFFSISHNSYKMIFNDLILSRYNISNQYLKEVKVVTCDPNLLKLKRNLLCKFDNIIMTDATYSRLKNVKLVFNQLDIINSWFSFYNKNTYPSNTKIFNENYLCGKVNYHKKICVELLKNKYTKDKMFILANGERRLTQHELDDISFKFNCNKVLCQDIIEGLDITNYTIYSLKDPLFDYSTYLYVPTKTYEFAPRMLLESIFLGKNVEIYKYPENKNQRFIDIMNNDINKYKLTLNDEIIRNL